MSSGTLYASFKFEIECHNREDFNFVVDLCDTDELSNRICEYDEDDGVEVTASQENGESPLNAGKYLVTLSLGNTEVRGEIDDVLDELYKKLKERGLDLKGYVVYETEDGEHVRGDFSTGCGQIDYEDTDSLLGYSVDQLRELKLIAEKKWGKPSKL